MGSTDKDTLKCDQTATRGWETVDKLYISGFRDIFGKAHIGETFNPRPRPGPRPLHHPQPLSPAFIPIRFPLRIRNHSPPALSPFKALSLSLLGLERGRSHSVSPIR
ncbi:hypothetical protein D5F01_LYC22138 [Xyrichtys novacula]|uniref:Uncharacterized protein n=1 Tax=Xyrichtys novacula TaxID=13765 RepID=A0AAV1HAX3_XYRNO|nr:hypothetical protein D5F01_LYC22138 [Xyrichtys novacula]